MMLFTKAFEKKEERDILKKDQIAWLQGMYFAYAIGAIFDRKIKYPEEPFSLLEKLNDDTDEEEQENKVNPDAQIFGAWAMMYNKQFREKR